MVNDQLVPRYDFSFTCDLFLTTLWHCRRGHNDHELAAIRERVLEYRSHLIYCAHFQRVNHGSTRNYHLVRIISVYGSFLSANCSKRHVYMVIAEIVTLFLYVISMAFLPEYFGT